MGAADISFDDLIPGAPQKPVAPKDISFADLIPVSGQDRAQAAASGVNRGVMVNAAGLPVDTALNVWDLLKAAYGTAGGAFGMRPENMPQLTDRTQIPGSSAYIASKLPQTMIAPNRPDDALSRLFSAGGQGVGATMVGGGSAANLVRNLTMGGVSQVFPQAVAEAGGSPSAQILASLFPQAATQAGAATGRGLLRGGDEGRQQMQDRMTTLAQGGVNNPSVGLATGGVFPQWLESVLSKLPGGGSVMAQYGANTQAGVGARVGQIRDQVSPAYGPEIAGSAFQNAVKGEGGYKDKMNRIYDGLDARVTGYIDPTALFPVANTLDRATALTAPIPGAPATSSALTNPRIADVTAAFRQDAAANAGQMPFAATQALATKVGQESRSNAIVGTPEQGAFKQLYGALAADKMAAANAADPAAAAALSRANNFYSGARNQIDTLQPFVNTTSPERTYNMFANTARTAPSLAADVSASLPGDVRRVQAATYIAQLGSSSPGQQNATGTKFSTNTFLTNWNKLPDAGKRAIINGFPGSGTVRGSLDKVAQTADMISQASKVLSNPSGTGPAMANVGALSAAGGAALTGHPTVAAGILGSAAFANVGARVMTNPIFVHWLSQTTTLPPGRLGQQLTRLAVNAGTIKDPQDRAAVQQFVQSLGNEYANQPQ